RIFTFLGRCLALCQHAKDAINSNNFAALVQFDIPAVGYDRTACKFGLLDFASFITVKTVNCISWKNGPVKIPLRTGNEYMNALEQAFAKRPDFIRDRIARDRADHDTCPHPRRPNA